MCRVKPDIRVVVLVLSALVLPAAHVAAQPFGINGHTPNDAVADRIVEGGISWVRIDFRWSLVEPERDVYDWQFYDALIDRLEARNLRILANFHDTPVWATSGPEFSGVPSDADQVQELLYLAAKRYRGRIHAWGLWNEPNLDRFWEGSRTEYIDIVLLPGIAGLRTGDPGALICAPHTSHLSSARWNHWLADVIEAAGDQLDVIAHHVYPSEASAFQVTDDLNTPRQFPWERESVRQVLEEAGWFGRPFWLGETGVESGVHGVDTQAEFYEELLDLWFGPDPEATWMDRIFFYEIHDPQPPEPWTFGILSPRPELVAKPSFHAYRDFIENAVVDDAVIADHDAPAYMAAGDTVTITLNLLNTGTTTWRAVDGYEFGFAAYGFGWTFDGGPVDPGFETPPGEAEAFEIELQSPWLGPLARHTTALVTAEMLDAADDRFGEPLRIAVTSSIWQPAVVVEQPRSVVVTEGRGAILSVSVESDTPATYQWRRNSVELSDGVDYSGTNSPRLMVHSVDRHLVGDYDCVVSNSVGPVSSDVAQLTTGTVAPARVSGLRTPESPWGSKWREDRELSGTGALRWPQLIGPVSQSP